MHKVNLKIEVLKLKKIMNKTGVKRLSEEKEFLEEQQQKDSLKFILNGCIRCVFIELFTEEQSFYGNLHRLELRIGSLKKMHTWSTKLLSKLQMEISYSF